MEQPKDTNTHLNNILAQCAKGNVLHQEMLYKHFYGYALSICRLYTYSNDDAVTILNDSFLKVFSTIEKKGYSNSVPFKNWLRRILINTAIDNYRKNSKHYHHLDVEEAVIIEADVHVIEDLTVEDILKLLDQLPKLHRLVFNMFEIQGFSHKEIAEKLEVSESTSRVFLTRAKKKLRALIGKDF